MLLVKIIYNGHETFYDLVTDTMDFRYGVEYRSNVFVGVCQTANSLKDYLLQLSLLNRPLCVSDMTTDSYQFDGVNCMPLFNIELPFNIEELKQKYPEEFI